MTQERKHPTIQDVARFAQVSTATVSRALSAPSRVSDATRERVSEAVRVTGYTINQAARSLRQKSTRTIVVALPDMRNSFFSTILDSVEREATLRGYGMLVANLHLGHQPVSRLQEYLLSNRADGLLLLDGSVDGLRLRSLANMPNAIPLVVACEEIPASGFHTVVTDNMRAAERATRHLIELGHRDIGHLLGPEGNIIARERLAGFKAMLDQFGLDFRPDWVLKGNFNMESGFAAASRFMAQPQRPTAIFAANDESAIGFLSGLRQHGLRCPEDVSVIGFDDLAVAPHFAPPLTTMRQPREALGRIAASALMDLLDGSSSGVSPLRIVLNSELIVRASTAPPTP